MDTFLKVLRWGSAVLLLIFLVVYIFVSIPLMGALNLITEKDNPKKWLENVNAYDELSDTVIETILEKADENDAESLSFLDEETKKRILKTSFSADWFQEQTENNIDIAYEWLEGDNDDPKFVINLEGKEDIVRREVKDTVKKEFSLLPSCGTEGVVGTDYYSYLSDGCIPEDVTEEMIDDFLDKQIPEEKFIEDEIIELNKGSIDSRITNQVTLIYQLGKNYSFVFWTITVVTSLIIVFLIPGWAKGLITLSIFFILLGGFWVGASVIGNGVYDNIYDYVIDSEDIVYESGDAVKEEFLDTLLRDGLNFAYDDVMSNITINGILILLLGVIFLIIGLIVRWQIKKREITAQNIQVQHNI